MLSDVIRVRTVTVQRRAALPCDPALLGRYCARVLNVATRAAGHNHH
jgi:hypothetical protein